MNAIDRLNVGAWLAAQRDLERLDRELLACRALGLSRAGLLAHPETPLDPASAARLDAQAQRRRNGEPLAYILGEREFWGLDFEVSAAVLVPRPETELLVQTGLDGLHTQTGLDGLHTQTGLDGLHTQPAAAATTAPALSVLDLGTGSGAVAVALGRAARQAGLTVTVTATDSSAAALALAARNAGRHGVAVRLLQGDWFAPVSGRYHLIVSNPPYVAAADVHLEALRHEPRGALVAGPDGLDDLRRIGAGALAHLQPGGMLALEHGFDQGAAVRRMLEEHGLQGVATRTDLAGHERVTLGWRPQAAL